MRVLIVPYPESFKVVGGHVTQQLETVKALERAGVVARLGTASDAQNGSYDIVHAFGDVRPLLASGRPQGRLVVSPIYFPRWLVFGPHFARPGHAQMFVTRIRHHAAALRHPDAWRERHRAFASAHAALAKADLVVVNSCAEAALLRRDATADLRIAVAYSGVADEAFDGDPAYGRDLTGIGDGRFILSVARVEPIKNTLGLARAARGLPCRLVVIGAILPGHERYYDAVRKAAPDMVHIPHLPHELIRNVHAAASVHALPSWYETTGLSTLEALAAGNACGGRTDTVGARVLRRLRNSVPSRLGGECPSRSCQGA